MNNTLKQIQEKGEEDFNKVCNILYIKDFLDSDFDTKIKDFLHQQTTLAYNAGKADMLDTVLKEIDSLDTVDIKDESGDVVQEQLISKDKLKNKLLDKSK